MNRAPAGGRYKYPRVVVKAAGRGRNKANNVGTGQGRSQIGCNQRPRSTDHSGGPPPQGVWAVNTSESVKNETLGRHDAGTNVALQSPHRGGCRKPPLAITNLQVGISQGQAGTSQGAGPTHSEKGKAVETTPPAEHPPRPRPLPGGEAVSRVVLGAGPAVGQFAKNKNAARNPSEFSGGALCKNRPSGFERVGPWNVERGSFHSFGGSGGVFAGKSSRCEENGSGGAFPNHIRGSDGGFVEKSGRFFSPLSPPRCGQFSCKQRSPDDSNSRGSNAQGLGHDENLCGPSARPKGEQGSSEVSFSSLEETAGSLNFKTCDFLSSLNLGFGPLCRGWGLVAPTCSQISLFEADDFGQTDVYTPTKVYTPSSGTPTVFGTNNFRTPSIRSNRILDEITTNVIDTQIIRKWDDLNEASGLLDCIEKVEIFQSLFVSHDFSDIRRSNISIDNTDRLLNWDTVELCVDEPKAFLKSFQVPKKTDFDRFVADGTPLNRAQRPPPHPNIPRLLDIFTSFSRRKYFFSIDAVSFFYQFELSQDIRNYFVFMMNRKRGKSVIVRLKKLCMGWKYSPAVAQRTSNVIIREIRKRLRMINVDCEVEAWIDNFIFGFDTFDDATLALPTIVKVFEEANVKIHSPSTISTSLDALGFDISFGSIRHNTKFCQKIRAHFTALNHLSTLRELAVFIGEIIWTVFARNLPLCFYPLLSSTLRDIQKLRKRGVHWDAPCHLALHDLLLQVSSLIDTVATAFVSTQLVNDLFVEIMSDAMSEVGNATWAFVSGDHVSQGNFFGDHHIFLLELVCAAEALLWAASRHNQAILYTDNTAALFALRAGHCGNAKGDRIIKRIFESLPFDFRFYIAHVSTHFNFADPFTRGAIGHPGHHSLVQFG